MGYLVLTRKEGEQLRLPLAPGADPEKLIQHLIRDGKPSTSQWLGTGQPALVLRRRLRSP
jgi:hypothetical protein